MMFLHESLKHNFTNYSHDIICIIELLQQLPAVENNIKNCIFMADLLLRFTL